MSGASKLVGVLDWVGRSVSDLMELGYPESVAKRISSGELPMDEASRMARAVEQGYDLTPMYHGAVRDKVNFRGKTWTTDSPYTANTYSTIENGSIYPLLTKKPEVTIDAGGNVWNEIPYDGGIHSTDTIMSDAAIRGDKVGAIDNVIDIGGTASKAAKLTGNRKHLDPSNVRATTTSIDTVRSLLSAAFDPEYTGSNILGSRMAPTAGAGLLGILGLTEKDLEDLK